MGRSARRTERGGGYDPGAGTARAFARAKAVPPPAPGETWYLAVGDADRRLGPTGYAVYEVRVDVYRRPPAHPAAVYAGCPDTPHVVSGPVCHPLTYVYRTQTGAAFYALTGGGDRAGLLRIDPWEDLYPTALASLDPAALEAYDERARTDFR